MKININRKNLIAAFAIASIAGASIFATSAFAQGDIPIANNLASKIAEKFNLDENEVKSALEEFREDQRQEFEDKFNEKLDQAVTDGEITEEQKSLIITKRDEIKQRLDEIHNIEDKSARQEAMKTLREETKSWAEENNIPIRWLNGAGIHKKDQKMHKPVHNKENSEEE